MEGFHKAMFKIQGNIHDADGDAKEGYFNNVTFMPVLKYSSKKLKKSLTSVFFYQPEMMVSQYVPPKTSEDYHFFDMSQIKSETKKDKIGGPVIEEEKE